MSKHLAAVANSRSQQDERKGGDSRHHHLSYLGQRKGEVKLWFVTLLVPRRPCPAAIQNN